jgi:hypothetical protein
MAIHQIGTRRGHAILEPNWRQDLRSFGRLRTVTVLREVAEGGRHVFIGEAYLHGYMDELVFDRPPGGLCSYLSVPFSTRQNVVKELPTSQMQASSVACWETVQGCLKPSHDKGASFIS